MANYFIYQARRPKREVIVQRIEPPAGAPVAGQAGVGGGGRGDEWADPWMRSKSPGGRGKVPRVGSRRQSYSSASSYSSSRSDPSFTFLYLFAVVDFMHYKHLTQKGSVIKLTTEASA